VHLTFSKWFESPYRAAAWGYRTYSQIGRFTNSGLTIQVYLPNMARSYEIFSEKGRKSRENPW
jgi:hypothetical protein